MIEAALTEAAIALTCAFIAVLAYGLLAWRLMAATHEFRVRAGRDADRLAQDPRVSDGGRVTLTRLADAAYGFFTPWVVLLASIVAISLPLREYRRAYLAEDTGVAREVALAKSKMVIALISTSPLACALAVVVLAAGLLLRGSVEALTRYIAAAGDRFGAGTAGYSRPA